MSTAVHLILAMLVQFVAVATPCLLVPYPYSPFLGLVVGLPAAWWGLRLYCRKVSVPCRDTACTGRMWQRGATPVLYVCDACETVHNTRFNYRRHMM